MAVEFLIALLLLTALLSGVVGYALARRGGPRRSDLEALERELEKAEQRAEAVQANVTGHFEQSAMLFGQLARDYRAFLEHFSESAQTLGISEVKARELLARADQPLLGQTDDVIDGETAQAAASADAPREAAEPASAVAADEAVTGGASADEASADEASADEVSADEAPAEDEPADEPEPPLIDDVVEPAAKPARVVDVEVDALGLPVEDADREPDAGLRRRG